MSTEIKKKYIVMPKQLCVYAKLFYGDELDVVCEAYMPKEETTQKQNVEPYWKQINKGKRR